MEWLKIDDETRWPNPAGEEYKDLAWRLRYAQDGLTKSDLYNAATVMNTYSDLVLNPALILKTIQRKISGIRKAIKSI